MVYKMASSKPEDLNEDWGFWTKEYEHDNRLFDIVKQFKGIMPHDYAKIRPPFYHVQ